MVPRTAGGLSPDPYLFHGPRSLGQIQPPSASLSDGPWKSRVSCHAQSSLLAPERPTCLCGSQMPHLREYLERLLRQLGCAPLSPQGHPSRSTWQQESPAFITWHHPALKHLSLISSQIDTETFELWAPAGRPGDSICYFQSDSVPKDSLRPHCPNAPAWPHLLLWSPEICSYQLCLFLILLFPETT